MLISVRFDPAADPWGTAMLACLVLCGFVMLWALVAIVLRQPARGAGRVMSLGVLGYLLCATGGTAARVMATPPPAPAPAPTGPPIIIEAKVPIDPDEDPAGAAAQVKDTKAASAAVKPATIVPAELTPTAAPQPDAPTDAQPDASPTPAVATPDAVASAPPTPAPPVDLGPPTLAGREALRFVDEVSHDPDKCADARQVAAAVRELPGALSDVPRTRVDKAVGRLETCRRKIVWARAFTIRRNRITDRETLALAIPERLRAQDIAVRVTLRGASRERIRIGGANLDAARARALLDGGLHDELADVGFTEITLADMSQSITETPTVPTDADLAASELASLGLDRKIELP